MYNFDSYNVLLAIATNIPVLLMTAFVLQGHILSIALLKLYISCTVVLFCCVTNESCLYRGSHRCNKSPSFTLSSSRLLRCYLSVY